MTSGTRMEIEIFAAQKSWFKKKKSLDWVGRAYGRNFSDSIWKLNKKELLRKQMYDNITPAKLSQWGHYLLSVFVLLVLIVCSKQIF